MWSAHKPFLIMIRLLVGPYNLTVWTYAYGAYIYRPYIYPPRLASPRVRACVRLLSPPHRAAIGARIRAGPQHPLAAGVIEATNDLGASVEAVALHEARCSDRVPFRA